jgi:glutamate-1-semialdehyde 2,1-aminomutase
MAQITKTIEQEFIEEFDGSRQRAMQALEIFPSGITHDVRYTKPFPLYVSHALGSKKWDVDGHEIIDYSMGHGAVIAGHNNPAINDAVAAQLGKGTHFGASHDYELEWGDWVQRLVPSAERVKFTSSGTESTLLAMRVARAFTGREQIMKFAGHFHGWNDYVIKGERPPFDNATVPGVPRGVSDTVVVAPVNDLDFVDQRLAQGDVAAVILEPSGASYATIPLPPGFLTELRAITERRDTLLIFDEVITGFRWAPGGAQDRFGIRPDLTTMAKIVAGGLPGGSVAGRADVMAVLEFRDSEPGWNSERKVGHPGTYNGNPLAAIAGSRCLEIVSDARVQEHCDKMAARFRAGANAALVKHDVPGFVYGEASVFHIMLGERCTNLTAGDLHTPAGVTPERLKSGPSPRIEGILTAGMLLEGAHLFHAGGLLSVAHTEDDIDKSVTGFERTVVRMRDEGFFDGA